MYQEDPVWKRKVRQKFREKHNISALEPVAFYEQKKIFNRCNAMKFDSKQKKLEVD